MKIKNPSLKILLLKFQKVRMKTKIRKLKTNYLIKFQSKIKNKASLSSKKLQTKNAAKKQARLLKLDRK